VIAARDVRKDRRARLAQRAFGFLHPRRGLPHFGIRLLRRVDEAVERRVAVELPPVGAQRLRLARRRLRVLRRQLHRRALVVGADRAPSEQHYEAGASHDAGAAAGACCVLRGPATTEKKSGMNSVATKVASSMPPTTPVPIERRAAAPAPLANISGSTPKTKASEVMTIGRKRRRAAFSAASMASLPSRKPCCANSTIRMAFFAARPI